MRLGTGQRGRGRHLSVSHRRPPPVASPGLQPRATGCPGGRRGSEDREGRGAACPPRPLLGGHRAPFPHFLWVREVRRPPRCASDGFCTACVMAFLPVADMLPPSTPPCSPSVCRALPPDAPLAPCSPGVCVCSNITFPGRPSLLLSSPCSPKHLICLPESFSPRIDNFHALSS